MNARIKEIKKRKRELELESRTTVDLDRLKEINRELEALADEQYAIEAADERGGVPEDAELRNSDALKAYGLNGGKGNDFNIIATFGNTKTTDNNPYEGAALRSGESFSSRFAKGSQPLDGNKFWRGVVTGNWDGAENEHRAMNMSGSGVIVPAVLAARCLDKARSTSLFLSAECPTIPMENGNYTVARVAQDPTFAFYPELGEMNASDMTLEGVELRAKTARGYIMVSRELFYSAVNLNEILNQALGGAIAEMIDRTLLYGQNGDNFAPVGIFNDPAVLSIEHDYGRHIYNTILEGNYKVRENNGTPDVLAMNAYGEKIMLTLYGSDKQYIVEPELFKNLNKVVSNSFKTYENDSGRTVTDMLIFDKNAVIVGIQKNITVRMIDNTDECIRKNAIIFEVNAMLDAKAVRPDHICKLQGVNQWTTEGDAAAEGETA